MNEATLNSEICCVCGRRVDESSFLFVNRVPDLNDLEGRVAAGRPFPHGEWVCVICDNTDSDGEQQDPETVFISIECRLELLTIALTQNKSRFRTRNGSRGS